MKQKFTLIVAVLEAIVLLVMKTVDWKEAKQQKPNASQARRAAGKRVVKPSSPGYDKAPPEGESSAINILAGSSATDEEIHQDH